MSSENCTVLRSLGANQGVFKLENHCLSLKNLLSPSECQKNPPFLTKMLAKWFSVE